MRLAQLLRPFAKVEPDEAITALALMATVFLLLMAHYVLKTAREPLILLHGGAEAKSYTAAGQAVLLLALVPAYSGLARRMNRMKLIAAVYGFFALNLVVFASISGGGVFYGVAFHLWVGIFNVSAIAVFWSFANDVYQPDQGKRLFAVLGIGSSCGAVAGALVAGRLAELGPRAMMLSAAALLAVCVALFTLVHRREGHRIQRASADVHERQVIDGPVLDRLLRDRFVLLIALLTLLLNCVNSNGEYVLDRALLASVGDRAGSSAAVFVSEFKAQYFGWINALGVLLQMFAASRIIGRLGVRKTLFVLPVVAFASYSLILSAPLLVYIQLGKIAENSLDYSVHNTARHALFLVGTRTEKYVGNTVVDTMVVRLGDVVSAGLVALGSFLALPISAFAALNLGFIACWLWVLVVLGREHGRRKAEELVLVRERVERAP